MVTRNWDLTLMLGDNKTIFLFLMEKEGIRETSLVYFFVLIHGQWEWLNMWPTVWKPECAPRRWADFKTDRPEAELIVRCVLAFLSLPYPLGVSLISTCAPTVWDFRHHVCESALTQSASVYGWFIAFYTYNIWSFKAMTESFFSPNCGKFPPSVGKRPYSVQSEWKWGLMAVGCT